MPNFVTRSASFIWAKIVVLCSASEDFKICRSAIPFGQNIMPSLVMIGKFELLRSSASKVSLIAFCTSKVIDVVLGVASVSVIVSVVFPALSEVSVNDHSPEESGVTSGIGSVYPLLTLIFKGFPGKPLPRKVAVAEILIVVPVGTAEPFTLIIWGGTKLILDYPSDYGCVMCAL